jgi:Zn-dependent M28 family amino/carboxypeptidase
VGFDPENPGVFAPGADDNASGVAAVLEVARERAAMRFARPQRRGIVIAFWGGEELGLLGSSSFVADMITNPGRHPNLDDIALVLNLDMVGRGFPQDDPAPGGAKTVLVVGAARIKTAEQYSQKNPALAAVLAHAAAADPGLKFVYDDGGKNYFMRTDTYSFVAAKPDISTLFFTGPEHEDYHNITDTPDKLDYRRLARIARLTLEIALRVADSSSSLLCVDCS